MRDHRDRAAHHEQIGEEATAAGGHLPIDWRSLGGVTGGNAYSW